MRARVTWLLTVVLTVASCEECSSPSAPSASTTPPPVTQVSDPPALTCPKNVSITAPSSGPAIVSYDAPAATAGEHPVTVACSPESGTAFPVGSSGVQCIATDALKRTATCSFSVFVAAAPQPRLRLNRILAFGDSITVGEIITPNTDNLLLTPTPSAAYPTILSQLLKARYGDRPVVFNAGLSGEKAVAADRRFAPTLGAFSPEAVVLLEGSNDLLYADPSAGVEAVELGIGVIAAEARNRRIRVFICTLPPSKPGRRHIPLGIVAAANDRLRNIARLEGAYLIDVFTPLLQDLDANIGPDGLHPTELGYRRIAETVFAALRADLEVQ